MTRARRDQRWREQAARLIVSACWPEAERRPYARHSDNECEWCNGVNIDAERLRTMIAIGMVFDVAHVRAYCVRLIAEADALDEQREVFADWTRDRGLGPENRADYAFIQPSASSDGRCTCSCSGYAREVTDADRDFALGRRDTLDHAPGCRRRATRADGSVIRHGGWPGNLAREWQTTKCTDCSGRGFTVHSDCANDPDMGCHDGWHVSACFDTRVRCGVCHGRGRVRVRKCSRRDCDGGVLVGNGWVGDDGVPVLLPHAERFACPECEVFKRARPSRAFVNGGNLRRAAQRLIDTLAGRCPWAPRRARAAERVPDVRSVRWPDFHDGRRWRV